MLNCGHPQYSESIFAAVPVGAIAMLDTVSSQQSYFYEDQVQGFDISYLIQVLKRRVFHFIIPFLIVALAGFAVTEFQRPIYRAEGKMLVESAGISSDLLHPTISELIDERFEVYKERILSPENLVATVDKFNLFPGLRDRISGFQLLELMRKRVSIKPVPLEMQPNRPTTAFSVSFDYEVPELALKVDTEFLNEILSQDSSRRASSAAQTVQLLDDQVTKLKAEHDAIVAQLESAKQRPPDERQAVSEEVKAQMNSLAGLESELAQKSSSYSDEHPVIKKLKKDIATLKHMIAAAPQKSILVETVNQPDAQTQVLTQRQALLEKSLDDARNKLTVARLGESLEKSRQAQHLQIIQYPELPGSPVKPKKLMWFAVSVALAGMLGLASVALAELLNRSIRSKKELARFCDPHLIVTVPYLVLPGEQRRRRLRLILLCLALVIITGASVTIINALKPKGTDFPQLSLVSH